MIELYIIRHGQSERNYVQRQIIGGGDSPLASSGRVEMLLLGCALRVQGFALDELHHSPLSRAKESAEILRSAAWVTCQIMPSDPRTRELEAGEWEGKEKAKIYTPALLAEIAAAGMNHRPPGGESMNDVADRGIAWLSEQAARYKTSRGRIGLVSHGQWTRSMIACLFGVDPLKAFLLCEGDNASVTKIVETSHGWRLVYANRTAQPTF